MDIEGIKSDFESIWVAFIEAVVRFWNNRFLRQDDEIHYLREQNKQLQLEIIRLAELMGLSKTAEVSSSEVDDNELQPIQREGSRVPWHIKQRRLEIANRNRARELAKQFADEASMKVERAKSTEQLEDELLHGEINQG